MGRRIWLEKKLLWIQPSFYLLTTTLLSLLLPLSFLLVARLSTSYSLFSLDRDHPITHPSNLSSILISLFIETNPSLLHALVFLIAAATLFHGLTGQTLFITEPSEPNSRPNLYISWILLCTLQLCIGLGIEAIIAAGIDGDGFGHERNSSGRIVFVFLLGLHETMLYWWRVVVKPVVDDTVFGFVREERWVERAVMGCGFGALWWWRLRDEVESLVDMVEYESETPMGVGIAGIVGWWLYYLIVTIGVVRIVKGIITWVGVILLYRLEANPDDDDDVENEDLEEV